MLKVRTQNSKNSTLKISGESGCIVIYGMEDTLYKTPKEMSSPLLMMGLMKFLQNYNNKIVNQARQVKRPK